jgi:hypothetical protein
VKLLQHILNSKNKLLFMGSCLFISAIISGSMFAETGKDGFPPIAEDEKTKATAIKKATPATNTATRQIAPAASYQQPQQRYYYPQQAPRYYYPQQQMQAYRAYPYGYYPQQQQMPNYAPRQWTYPQQRYNAPYQPYRQNQATPYQKPANYTQILAYQKNQATRAATNNTTSTGKKLYPMRKKIKKKKHAWGDERHIWPDFYTDTTANLWDKMINAPFDIGRMPGGWRAPSLSTPDPATVGDAVANQIPPIVEEMGNMTKFTN